MAIEWTESQRKVIDHGKGDLLVSASAGSGKTTVMLGRVLRLIDDGGDLDRMLISTFTVSAADDMRVKLARNLRERYASTREEKYLRALGKLPGADICTLHKWCQKLIRKYFYVCGDDPAFDIADGAESSLWLNESIDKAFALQEEKNDEDFAEICACYVRHRSDSPLKKIVKSMLSFSSARRDGRGWLENAAHSYDDCGACREYVNGVIGAKRTAAERSILAYEQAAADRGIADAARPFAEELRAMLDGADCGWTRSTKAVAEIKDLRDIAKARVTAALEYTCLVMSARNDEAGRAARKLSEIALAAYDLYEAKKAEKGKFDFTDLERRALRILESPEGDKVRASLDNVFIDEYQDINPLQESIIRLLGKGNLFFVGDVKQSIYAFRNCDPSLFTEKKRVLSAEEDGTAELNKNYRSRSGILNFCNQLFSRIMTEDFGMIDYRNEGSFAVDGGADDGSVEMFCFDDTRKKTEKADFSEVYSVAADEPEEDDGESEETRAIVRRIIGLVEEGYSYGDIAVLIRRRNTGEEKIASDLRALGIPVSVGSRSSLTEGRINKLLISVLRLADNFYDDVSLAAVMLSPVGGFSEDDLARLREKYAGESCFYGCVLRAAEDGDERVKEFVAAIDRYSRLSRVLRPGELAGRITSEHRLFAAALAEKGGASASESLGRLLSAASGFGGSLSEFLARLPEMSDDSDTIPQPGSIRIMTVHASKGLEFPVVIMCGSGRGYLLGMKRSLSVEDDEFGLGLESRSSETGERLPSLPLLAIRAKAEKAAREEELRVLYVALTRAMDKLILPVPASCAGKVVPPEEAGNFAELIAPVMKYFRVSDPPEERTGAAEKKVAPPPDPAVLSRMREAVHPEQIPSPTDIKKSVTGLLAEVVPTDDSAEGVKTLTGAEYEGEGAGEAMRRGTAYHAALEQADFSLTAEEQTARLGACVRDFGLVDPDKLDAALATMRAECAGGTVYREQPFIFVSDGEEEGGEKGLLIQGVIDLLVIRGNECEIVDYKTGGINAARRDKYMRQLRIYSAAAEKLLGLKVTRARAYLIDERRFMD